MLQNRLIASRQGGVIVNADALQVFDGWRILTARPDDTDLARAEHVLYGHVSYDAAYSVGHWLRDVKPYFSQEKRPIIVGGTGLNFAALTEGLAEIPATPDEVRKRANDISLDQLITGLDDDTKAQIDLANRARVQRAWEVQQATGQPIVWWQAQTPPPLCPLADATAIVLNSDTDWLNDRIARRFDQMLAQGAVEEARAMHANWNPKHLSSKAIGAPELIAYLNNETTLEAAKEAAIIASRQYAKRQRTGLILASCTDQTLESCHVCHRNDYHTAKHLCRCSECPPWPLADRGDAIPRNAPLASYR